MSTNGIGDSAIKTTPSSARLVKVDANALAAKTNQLKVYVVVANDNLTKIAKRFGVSLEVLEELNPKLFTKARRDGNLIIPGDNVVVPAQAMQQASEVEAADPNWLKPSAGSGENSSVNAKPADAAAKTKAKQTKASAPAEVKIPREASALSTEELNAQMGQIADLAKHYREAGAGALAEHYEAALKSSEPQERAVGLMQVYSALLPQFGGDEGAAAKMTAALVTAEKAKEKLGSGVDNVDVDLSKQVPSGVAKSKALELIGTTGDPKGFESFWKDNHASLTLLDDTVARLTNNDKAVSGDSGLRHATIAKALKKKFPDAQVSLLGLTATQKLLGLSSTGELGFIVTTQTAPTKVPFKFEVNDQGKVTVRDTKAPGEKVLVSIGQGQDGIPMFTGKTAPGGTVVLTFAGQPVQVQADGKGNWAAALSAVLTSPEAIATGELTLSEQRIDTYIINPDAFDSADLRGLSAEALQAKLDGFTGPTLGGTLRKTNVEAQQQMIQLPIDGVLAGKPATVSMAVGVVAGDGQTLRTFNFIKENAKAFHGAGFTKLAVEAQEPESWTLSDIEAKTKAAEAQIAQAFDLDTSGDRSEMYKEAVKQLQSLHKDLGGREELQVSALPVVVDTPQGRSYTTPVFRVDGPKGTVFVDAMGKRYSAGVDLLGNRYSAWEDYLKNAILDPDCLMTVPANGKLEFDANGKPMTLTQNTPDTIDTPTERAMLYGGYALTVAGMGIGFGTLGTMVMAAKAARALKSATDFAKAASATNKALETAKGSYTVWSTRAGQVGQLMQKQMKGFAGLSLGTAGYSGYDRWAHSQTFSPTDAGARQLYYSATFALMLPALRAGTLVKGTLAPRGFATATGAKLAGQVAMPIGQLGFLGGTIEEAYTMWDQWDNLALKNADKAMFLANAGMMVGFTAMGGLRGMFSPKFMGDQAKSMIRVPETLGDKVAQMASGKQSGLALTPKEADLLRTKLEGLVGIKEAHDARLIFRDVFPSPLSSEQVTAFKGVIGKLSDSAGIANLMAAEPRPAVFSPQELALLKNVLASPPAWQPLEMPEELVGRMEALMTKRATKTGIAASQAFDQPSLSWFIDKLGKILSQPKNLEPGRVQELTALLEKLKAGSNLTRDDAFNLVQVMQAINYDGIAKPFDKKALRSSNSRVSLESPTLKGSQLLGGKSGVREHLKYMERNEEAVFKSSPHKNFKKDWATLKDHLTSNAVLTPMDKRILVYFASVIPALKHIQKVHNAFETSGTNSKPQPGSRAAPPVKKGKTDKG